MWCMLIMSARLLSCLVCMHVQHCKRTGKGGQPTESEYRARARARAETEHPSRKTESAGCDPRLWGKPGQEGRDLQNRPVNILFKRQTICLSAQCTLDILHTERARVNKRVKPKKERKRGPGEAAPPVYLVGLMLSSSENTVSAIRKKRHLKSVEKLSRASLSFLSTLYPSPENPKCTIHHF